VSNSYQRSNRTLCPFVSSGNTALCFAAWVLLIGLSHSLQAREVTLLPLGDSITENPHWRYPMWKMLLDDGHAVDMVGTRNKGGRPDYRGQKFDADHEGYWGISAEWLFRKADGLSLTERLEKIKTDSGGRLVDIVTYHIGTNDINTSDRAHGEKYVDGTTVRFIEQTIDALRAHNPDITILLCRILPIKGSQTVRMGLVSHVNKRVDEIAERKNRGNKRSRVIVVDQNEGFDATNGVDTYDGMHPNDAGGRKMAAKFYQAIKAHWKAQPAPAKSRPSAKPAPSTPLDGWPELRELLFRSRGIYRELPRNVVTHGYCGGPLLGNGEIGAAIGGDAASQSIYLNRVDFWNRGLGGVTITAEGQGTTPDSFRYVQDIERAEVRSRVTIAGHPTTMNTWIAVDQPLVVAELANTSSREVTYRIQSWTKGPQRSVDTPYYLCRGNRPNKLHDLGDGISVKPKRSKDSGKWVFEATKRDGEVFLKNVGTGRYLYVADKNATTVDAGPIDPDGTPGAVWEMPNTRYQFVLKNTLTGKVLDSGDDGLTVKEDTPEDRNKLQWAIEMPECGFHPAYSGSDRDLTWAQAEYGGGYAACAAIVTRVLGNREVATDQATATVTVPGGESVWLVISVDGDGNRSDQADKLSTCFARGRERVMGVTSGNLAKLTTERVDWWRDFWMKSYVDLGDDLLNRFWYGAFYSLSCTSRGNNECPGLWGTWITLQFTKWGNAKTLNYNYQSPFYGVYSGNRPELAEPYYTDVLYNLPWAQFLAARAGYKGGMLPRIVGPQGGIGFPAGPTPVAETKDRRKLPNDQLDSMAFVAMNFINHYTYTLDEKFLREKAWPVMLACADFYEDYLVFEGGRYVFKESAAREGGGDTNPCYPLAYCSFVFKSCLQVADLMELPESRREKWRHIIKHMSAFPTAEVDGMTVLKEAESLSRITIRGPGDNSSLLQTVHPGEGINLGSDPALLKIGHDTVKYLNSEPARYAWSQHNNFPMIFTQAARVGWDAEDLWRQFKARITAELRPNLTVEQWGGGIESSGATEAVHSMLMQSHEDVLRLFPVWPRNREAKFARLRAKGAFVVSSMLKEGEVRYVRIFSERGTDCELVNPWPRQRAALYRDGKAAETLEGERFTLKTLADETLLLGPDGISHQDLQARVLESVRTDRTNLVNRFDTEKDLSRMTFAGAYGSMRPWWIDVPSEERLEPNPGRQGIIGVHPESTKVPCIVSREVSIPAKGNPRLRIVASACPRKGVVDYVMQAGIDNGEAAEWFDAELITGGPTPTSDGWKTFEYDLAKYAGQDVTLLLKVACGGENPWNCDIGYFDEISVIVE
jgi:alpha-L-fucosidase 2